MILSGQVSGQTLSDVLRALSQRRRNGVLSVDWGERAVRIALQEGKIVQAHDAASNMAVGICGRLTPSGILPEKIVSLVEKSGINHTQLYELLVGKKYVTAEEFERAQAGWELDLLHSLRQLQTGKIDFTSKLLRLDPRFQISVFPCQLLLDWAELEVDQERLADLLGPVAPQDDGWQRAILRKTDKEADILSERERLLYDLAAEGCDLKTLAERSLLSRYEVLQGVLSLLDQQLITAAGESLEDQVSEKYDNNFSPHVFEPALAPISPLNVSQEYRLDGSTVPKNGTGPDLLRDEHIVSSATENALYGESITAQPPLDLSEGQDDIAIDLDGEDFEPHDAQLEGAVSNEQFPDPAHDNRSTGVTSEEESLQFEEQVPADDYHSEKSIHGRADSIFRKLDYALLNEQVTNRLIIVTTVLYLISFALTGADLFDQWFKALADFTSNT